MIRDSAVIDLLRGEDSLLDTELAGVAVTRDAQWAIAVELQFQARPGSAFSEIKLCFTEVTNFRFSLEWTQAFLDVWDLKFLELEDGSFYITVDPDPWTLASAGVTQVQPSETDDFFVCARHVEAVVTKRAA